ncbi:ATP-binding cassette domain-containing protein [Pedobacter sp. KR3-3]|uniref:ATP-binding cassette domain-containing protein n=1 Tax=Pedobacter albus TaxID=3113905 RepID=A0ABU7I7V7_9SPHI|nr:ATP-binding cassette domain-containing protein [Pedobacter sp. KR3-3]MEE1945558.1 ATP-binding cassette domain-containing protein [Pedobacter sp. KR3-3]
MTHKLEADGIELSFGTRKILKSVYLNCETNVVTGLLGRNGEGKSCLMNIIYGSLKADIRSVRFNGTSVLQAFKRPDLLTYLPQFNFVPAILTLKRVFNDFELAFADFEAAFPEFAGRERAKVGQLSGGQRRLLEVYLIIQSKSQFSMLDEPFSNIMPLHIEKIKELIQATKPRKGFLITDHYYQHIMELGDRLYLLREGQTHLCQSRADLEWFGYVSQLVQ